MRHLLSEFWNDESAAIISAEMIMIGTMLVLGLFMGLVSLQQALTAEMFDMAGAMRSFDQSFNVFGLRGCKAQTFTSSYRNGRQGIITGQMGLASGFNTEGFMMGGGGVGIESGMVLMNTEAEVVPNFSMRAERVEIETEAADVCPDEVEAVDVCPPAVEAAPLPRKLKMEIDMEMELEAADLRSSCNTCDKSPTRTTIEMDNVEIQGIMPLIQGNPGVRLNTAPKMRVYVTPKPEAAVAPKKAPKNKGRSVRETPPKPEHREVGGEY